MSRQQILTFDTPGRGTLDITGAVRRRVEDSGIRQGIAHLFIQHSSASLMICENADPDVRADLESFFGRLVVDGDPLYRHRNEGPDDMPAHIRSILTNMDLTVPIIDKRLGLGIWQGIYLYEHRTAPHRRRVIITLIPVGTTS